MAEEKRLALLRSTVRSVAKYGMKDVSTRSISGDAGVNDAYIYRYFQDKEDLLKQAYLMENDKFMRVVLQRMELIREQSTGCTQQERFRLIFHVAWRYLIDTPDVCRFFLYYYNSPNFEKYARKEYHEQLNLLAEKVLSLFESTEIAKHYLYALFVLLNSFALQVVSGEVSDDMNAEERVFNMAFHAIKAEMKKEKPEGTYGIQNEGKDDGECRE